MGKTVSGLVRSVHNAAKKANKVLNNKRTYKKALKYIVKNTKQFIPLYSLLKQPIGDIAHGRSPTFNYKKYGTARYWQNAGSNAVLMAMQAANVVLPESVFLDPIIEAEAESIKTGSLKPMKQLKSPKYWAQEEVKAGLSYGLGKSPLGSIAGSEIAAGDIPGVDTGIDEGVNYVFKKSGSKNKTKASTSLENPSVITTQTRRQNMIRYNKNDEYWKYKDYYS